MKHPSIQESFFAKLKENSLAELLRLDIEAETSFLMEICPIQDPFRFRVRHIGLKAANLLIDEKGELEEALLDRLIGELKGPFLLGPGRENDPPIFLHLRSALQLLKESPEIRKWIKKFSPPLCHKRAEEIIRDTLWPEEVRKPDTAQIRRAVLAAWFTWLRQTVGSCFATAPAILIQRNDPISLFEDLYDLLTTGRIRRIISGQQFTVPLCPTFESADLRKAPPLDMLLISPGFQAACSAAGLKVTQGQLEEFEEPIHTDQIFRRLLLKDLGLTERDLEDEEYLKKVQMSPLLARQGAVYYQKASQRSQKVSEWKSRLEKATRAFCSFTECALLRTWEYTVASLCDIKLNFTRWNLFVGLGLDPNQKEGLGSFLYERMDLRLEECNRELKRAADEYDKAMSAIRALEGMVNRSIGDAHRQQLQSELATYMHAANMALEIRDRMVEKAERLSNLFSHLIQQYDLKLQDYFQEIYDPSLFVSEEAIFDDSPAGFRLVYKHGRSDPSLWTLIQNGEQYIESLRDFFILIEPDIASTVDRNLFPTLVSDLTTELVQYLQEPQFLHSAMERSKKNPLHQTTYKTPWDYASGGTMQTLLQGYFQRDRPFSEIALLPAKEEELIQSMASVQGVSPILMQSPTHAFIFQPGSIPSDWKKAIEAGKKYWQMQKISEEIQERAAHLLSDKIPQIERNLFLHSWRNRPTVDTFSNFRFSLIEALASIKGSKIRDPQAQVDSFLYETFPILPRNHLGSKLSISLQGEASLISSFEFLQGIKQDAMKRGLFQEEDLEAEWMQMARENNLAYPSPILFADTNWAGWYFGWVVGPSGSLELWRLNRVGSRGYPMSSWKNYFLPDQASAWVILNQPHEYTAHRNRKNF
ncbi:MAG: hypothetical protein JSS32_01450 [Verrucomicrobia bacterium]|nr:hypothetical protein [Verrucomicrobiota bacterium]